MILDNRKLLPGKAAYFFYYAAAAALIPFLTLHYSELGLSGTQIGFLTGIVPLITLIAASIWGAAADASQRHHALLITALVGAWMSILALSQVSTFVWMVPVVVMYALFIAPVAPILDNTIMGMLGEQREAYGRLRIWGAIGWGVVALGAGYVIEQNGLGYAFAAYLLLLAGLLLVCLRLPVDQLPPEQKIWVGLRALLVRRQWQLFLFIVLIQGVGMSIFMNFLFLRMESMGASKSLMGLSLAAATLSELPIWLIADKMLRRWGTKRMLALAVLAWAIRGTVYGLMTAPWMVIPASLLHGISFSVMWAASVAYAAESAPKGMGATVQGVLSGVTFGLGGAIGGFAGGVMYQSLGAAATFLIVVGMLLVSLLIFVTLGREPSAK